MNEIDELKDRIARLEKALAQSGAAVCPVCGGRMSASTKYPRFYCLQDFGLCGEWVLNKDRRGTKHPFTTFSRTSVSNGAVDLLKRTGDDFHYFLASGEIVERDKYMELAGLIEA